MPYIGNTIRAADDYRLIDDISSSFNGSTTSFALQVAGSAPVPFPKSPQQVLISVNGVIQEPDPTGASGFNLVGTNIVFSSAPTNGHAFFGIIYATADYLNSGGNFPSGSLGAPSITFVGDEDTGIYRKGSGSIGFVADSTEIANTDSNGITISSGNLILPADIIHNGDTDTKIRFSSNDQISLETGGNEKIRINNSTYIQLYDHIVPNNDSTKDIGLTGTRFRAAYVDNYYGSGANLTGINTDLVSDTSPQLGGNLDVNTKNIVFGDSGATTDDRLTFGAGTDLSIYHDNSNSRSRIEHSTDNALEILQGGNAGMLIQNQNSYNIEIKTNAEDAIKCIANGAVELYHNNLKKLSTNANGVQIHAEEGSGATLILTSDEGDDNADNWRLHANPNHNFILQNYASGSYEDSIVATGNGAVELYHDNGKKLETTSTGVHISTRLDVKEITRTDGVGTYGTMGGIHFSTKSVLPMDSSGNVINNDIELGSSSYRWKNIYTNDLHLSNEGSSNDVDSTWGNYTIQEGFEDLFLINHRTGKKFKFNLTEVG